jgi:hypothetical protein
MSLSLGRSLCSGARERLRALRKFLQAHCLILRPYPAVSFVPIKCLRSFEEFWLTVKT